MRQAAIFLLLVAWAPVLAAQADAPRRRRFTLLTGVGNSLGWFGAQGERYFAGDRLSVFGGLGYTPDVDANASGITVAAGLRGFTAGGKHRAFVELGISQIAVQSGIDRRLYGPGLQAGWQFVSRGGFTVMTSAGLGYIPAEDVSHPVQALIGLGLGYTWRRPPP
ncbi:MAG: hypothetical protein ACREOF_19475 [Gemmatimonadales bacterium]